MGPRSTWVLGHLSQFLQYWWEAKQVRLGRAVHTGHPPAQSVHRDSPPCRVSHHFHGRARFGHPDLQLSRLGGRVQATGRALATVASTQSWVLLVPDSSRTSAFAHLVTP